MNGYQLTARLKKIRGSTYLSATDQALFYELVSLCNENSWKETFEAKGARLCASLNISEKTLAKSRKSLSEAGLIRFRSCNDKRVGCYYSFVRDSLPADGSLSFAAALPETDKDDPHSGDAPLAETTGANLSFAKSREDSLSKNVSAPKAGEDSVSERIFPNKVPAEGLSSGLSPLEIPFESSAERFLYSEKLPAKSSTSGPSPVEIPFASSAERFLYSEKLPAEGSSLGLSPVEIPSGSSAERFLYSERFPAEGSSPGLSPVEIPAEPPVKELPSPVASPALFPADVRFTPYKRIKTINKERGARPASSSSVVGNRVLSGRMNRTENAGRHPELLHLPFSGERFASAWNVLVHTPKWRWKQNYALELSLRRLSRYEEDFAVELMERAIECNWTGVVFPGTDEKYREWLNLKYGNNRKLSKADKARRLLSEYRAVASGEKQSPSDAEVFDF